MNNTSIFEAMGTLGFFLVLFLGFAALLMPVYVYLTYREVSLINRKLMHIIRLMESERQDG